MKATVQIGTWNLNTRKNQIDFTHFIKHTLSPSPDFIVLGFQELHSQFYPTVGWQESIWEGQKRTGSLQIDSLEPLMDMVMMAIDIAHAKGAKYTPLYAARQTALGLFVIAKESVLVKSLYSGSIGTGLGGFYFNKGAIGLSLEIELDKHPGVSISLCFINCHLAAHEGEFNCKFRQNDSDFILSNLQMRSRRSKEYVLPESNQAIFLFGDLNYRLKPVRPDYAFSKKLIGLQYEYLALFQLSGFFLPLLDRTTIMKLIKDKNVPELLEHDELIFLRNHKQGMLSLFKEAAITFLPSYKLTPERTYSKKRLPAYCDRILYTNSVHTITPMSYSRIQEYSNSDHDPVIGMFLLEFVDQCVMTKSTQSTFSKTLYRIWIINRSWISLVFGYLVAKLIFSKI